MLQVQIQHFQKHLGIKLQKDFALWYQKHGKIKKMLHSCRDIANDRVDVALKAGAKAEYRDRHIDTTYDYAKDLAMSTD